MIPRSETRTGWLVALISLAACAGLAAGWFAADVPLAPSAPRPVGYFDATLRIVGTAAYTTLAVLFIRMTGRRAWLPPLMLLLALVDLRRISDPHAIGLGLIAISWLSTLVLGTPTRVPLRIAAAVVCGVSASALHALSVLP